jgi:hypothetical protein
MNTKFDELTKSLAQSVTRRAALKKFGLGLVGMALACLGLAQKAQAGGFNRCVKKCMGPCVDYYMSQGYNRDAATANCQTQCSASCAQWP